jgi:hypothetical protein
VPDSALQKVRDPVTPASQFAKLTSGGNWSQINHPTIFRDQPSFCRGCAWTYSDEETDFSKVDAIEVQTGPAGVPAASPAAPNPFTAAAFAFYERALDTGAHIAAVGSSDDHRGGSATGPFDSPVGRATTMVYGDQLSQSEIVEGVKGDHTYVKLFGNDGPNVEFTAEVPGREPAIIGDTTTPEGAQLRAAVTGASTTGRPGEWSLVLMKDGVPVETVPFTGDGLSQTFTPSGPGRYSLKVRRGLHLADLAGRELEAVEQVPDPEDQAEPRTGHGEDDREGPRPREADGERQGDEEGQADAAARGEGQAARGAEGRREAGAAG